jgi:hypothetical protein
MGACSAARRVFVYLHFFIFSKHAGVFNHWQARASGMIKTRLRFLAEAVRAPAFAGPYQQTAEKMMAV